MRPRIRLLAFKNSSHTGFPNGIYLRWGFVPCSLRLKYRYSVAFCIKIRNTEYNISFNIDNPISEADLERQRNELDYEQS